MRGKRGYDVHPSIRMVQEWVAGLKAKTGRTLEEWVALVKKDGPRDELKRREWLKESHGLGTNAAWWIAERAGEKPEGDFDDPEEYLKVAGRYVEEQYAGKRADLRPVFDELLRVARGIGKDVRVCPCRTIVPLYREHVFAQIKPSTNTRVDLGLALAKHTGRLPSRVIDTGGKQKKDRITHRIAISSMDEIDGDVKKWLMTAYELDAK
jgi:Domain of unknown function (DUF5655)/Domain of unknown function (DUF4287)